MFCTTLLNKIVAISCLQNFKSLMVVRIEGLYTYKKNQMKDK
jgi:hypothetical protein